MNDKDHLVGSLATILSLKSRESAEHYLNNKGRSILDLLSRKYLLHCIELYQKQIWSFQSFKIDLHLGMDKGLLESQELEGAAVGICNIGKVM